MAWVARLCLTTQIFPCEQIRIARPSSRNRGHAFANGCHTTDAKDEQRKLLAADLVILLFPLWWFSMPAIMKGWVDRVWDFGLAYGYQGAGNTYR